MKAAFGGTRYANVTATIALVLALGGTSYAAIKLPKDSVGSRQIKSNAVTSSKVRNGTLLARDFRAGQLRAGPRGDSGTQGIQGIQGNPGNPGPPGENALVRLTILPANVSGSTTVAAGYQQVAAVGNFTKARASSTVKLIWNGQISMIGSGTTTCQFQLRVDGKDAAGNTGAYTDPDAPGQAWIAAPTQYASASVNVYFEGLVAGMHAVTLWVRNGNADRCGTQGGQQHVYVEELATS